MPSSASSCSGTFGRPERPSTSPTAWVEGAPQPPRAPCLFFGELPGQCLGKSPKNDSGECGRVGQVGSGGDGLAFLGLLGFVFGEALGGGVGALGGELGLVLGDPLVGPGPVVVGAGEVGDHVLAVELEGTLGRGPVGPLRDLDEDGAELALLLVERLEAGDGVVGRADDGDVVLDGP